MKWPLFTQLTFSEVKHEKQWSLGLTHLMSLTPLFFVLCSTFPGQRELLFIATTSLEQCKTAITTSLTSTQWLYWTSWILMQEVTAAAFFIALIMKLMHCKLLSASFQALFIYCFLWSYFRSVGSFFTFFFNPQHFNNWQSPCYVLKQGSKQSKNMSEHSLNIFL